MSVCINICAPCLSLPRRGFFISSPGVETLNVFGSLARTISQTRLLLFLFPETTTGLTNRPSLCSWYSPTRAICECIESCTRIDLMQPGIQGWQVEHPYARYFSMANAVSITVHRRPCGCRYTLSLNGCWETQIPRWPLSSKGRAMGGKSTVGKP